MQFRDWRINELPDGEELLGYKDPELEETPGALGFEFDVDAECELGLGFEVEFAWYKIEGERSRGGNLLDPPGVSIGEDTMLGLC